MEQEKLEKKVKENEPKPVPKIGQEIYVPTARYPSHGMDNVQGGLATVVKVKEEKYGDRTVYGIQVAEHPHRTYYWEYNASSHQEEWKKEYGNQRAKPIPDGRLEFNRRLREWLW